MIVAIFFDEEVTGQIKIKIKIKIKSWGGGFREGRETKDGSRKQECKRVCLSDVVSEMSAPASRKALTS